MSRIALVALLLASALALAPLAAAQTPGKVFQPKDNSGAKNKCPKWTQTDWGDLKERIKEVLSDTAGVVGDIDKQVTDKVDDAKEKPIEVDIDVVTEDQFVNEYGADQKGFFGGNEAAAKEKGKSEIKGKAAYTYTSTEKVGGVQKIKVRILCKESNRLDAIDGDLRETIIHELVHAKLYAMVLLGVKPADRPFEDHDEKFFEEIKKLLDLLKANLKLAYAPGSQWGGEVVAFALKQDPRGGFSERIELRGQGAFRNGPLGDADRDGRFEVPIEILPLQLVSASGFRVDVHGGEGQFAEIVPGDPFPMDSFFDVFYTLESAPWPDEARFRSTANEAPPWGATHGNELPASDPTFRFDDFTVLPPDFDGDGTPDPYDRDDDNDGIPDEEDADPFVADTDGDGVPDGSDNCVDAPNRDQTDSDGGGLGDACDDDNDNDGVPDSRDGCPRSGEAQSPDLDGDGRNDACQALHAVRPLVPILLPGLVLVGFRRLR